MRDFRADTRRVDEVLEPVEYAIAQDAESFHQIQGTDLRIAIADPFPGVTTPDRPNMVHLGPMGHVVRGETRDQTDQESRSAGHRAAVRVTATDM
jgi:hypothetical protein